ncbi:hypothetical protein M408DRAFT_59847 [Serendipita vermifera MAFF 305830]|uniref:EamA domain-containing protein n=1 Tax=Serendipita vermifera MAFF 305830 TaxID=933852 RepID=A0A0C3BQJ9_SERVB|nr:hypothetical protein M408DRAFT_59847 [Serendipita vermifera MAFF 305830]
MQAGQLLSFCITSTSVITTELNMSGFALPTTQTWFLYFSLFITYTPFTIYKYGFKGWGKMILKDGWKYFFLAVADVEGNFLVVKAFQNTNLLSAMLLDTWAIPICMFFTWVYLRTNFHWSQYLGVFICCLGMGLLVYSDQSQNAPDGPGKSIWVGDVYMLAGATLYGFTNATEEFLVRRAPLYQVVGQLGMWGMIINGIQAAALEHEGMRTAPWDGRVIGFIVAYTVSMYILYTVAPILYRLASSTYFNLSILTSDFYGLIFGIFLFVRFHPYWLYFFAFVVVLSGLVTYFWHTARKYLGFLSSFLSHGFCAAEQGKVDSAIPAYVLAEKPPGDLEASPVTDAKN